MKRLCSYSYAFHLEAPIDRVFELFSDPRMLNRLTPAWFDLRPREPVPTNIGEGSEIRYRLRWRGLPLRWTSRIVEWRAPRSLTYEQLRGPYAFFRHEHRFETRSGGTQVLDRVLFRSGWSSWLDRTLVRADLERIFRDRALRAERLLGSTASGHPR